MATGDTLHRLARALCSDDLCERVLEPAIADLQHDGGSLAGYAAFWRSLAWCVVRDASARESRPFHLHAAAAFAIAVSAIGACELVFLHTSLELRQMALRVLYWGSLLPYVGWSARSDMATLMFGVPLAMLPALWYAALRSSRLPPAVALLTIALGTLLTFTSSGWIAPALVRAEAVAGHERFVEAIHDPHVYVAPLELDRYPDAEGWPTLIRGAVAPPFHRYPGYPTYVAPEDRGTAAWHRSVIKERLLLLALALLAGLLGWTIGARSRGRARVIA